MFTEFVHLVHFVLGMHCHVENILMQNESKMVSVHKSLHEICSLTMSYEVQFSFPCDIPVACNFF